MKIPSFHKLSIFDKKIGVLLMYTIGGTFLAPSLFIDKMKVGDKNIDDHDINPTYRGGLIHLAFC